MPRVGGSGILSALGLYLSHLWASLLLLIPGSPLDPVSGQTVGYWELFKESYLRNAETPDLGSSSPSE